LALHAIGALTPEIAMQQLGSKEEYLRAWTIQLLSERVAPDADALRKFAQLARNDPSPVVRLYLAATLQRMPFENRWPILEDLMNHPEDSLDPNLPMMYWYAAEPCISADPSRGAKLLGICKIPKMLEFIARRMSALSK
jgi:hypothetical protein